MSLLQYTSLLVLQGTGRVRATRYYVTLKMVDQMAIRRWWEHKVSDLQALLGSAGLNYALRTVLQ